MSGAWGYSFPNVLGPSDYEIDLVTLEVLKLELGITGTTQDETLQMRITRLSQQFAESCDRIFALIDVEETFQFAGNGCLCLCPCAGPQPIPLVLWQYPMVEIYSLVRDGVDITADEYDFDAESRLLWPRSGRWGGRIVANYSGGYDLPEGAPATLQAAVIEAVRQRSAFSAADPTIRATQHGDTRVDYYSAPLQSSNGMPSAVSAAIDQYRRIHV
jgi:hypothetical protein